MPVPDGGQLYWFDTPHDMQGFDNHAERRTADLEFTCDSGAYVYYSPDRVDPFFVNHVVGVRQKFIDTLKMMGINVLGGANDVTAIDYSPSARVRKSDRWQPVQGADRVVMVKSTMLTGAVDNQKAIERRRGLIAEKVRIAGSAVNGNKNRRFLTFAPDLRGWNTGEDLLRSGEVDEQDLVLFVADSMEGCTSVHEEMGLVHGDIKLDNMIGEHDGSRYRGNLNDFEYAVPRDKGFYGTCIFMTPYTCTPYVSDFLNADSRYMDMFSYAIAIMTVLKGDEKWLNNLFQLYMRGGPSFKLTSGKDIANVFLECLDTEDEFSKSLKPILQKMFESTDYSYTLADAEREIRSLEHLSQ